LGIDLFYSNLIWLKRPFKPGKLNDNSIFAEKGLKEKLAAIRKKRIRRQNLQWASQGMQHFQYCWQQGCLKIQGSSADET
jgi:hypothetical protein